jgi:hypothetical protein
VTTALNDAEVVTGSSIAFRHQGKTNSHRRLNKIKKAALSGAAF